MRNHVMGETNAKRGTRTAMALKTPRQMPKLCGIEVCCPSRDLWRVVCKEDGVITGKERRKGREVR